MAFNVDQIARRALSLLGEVGLDGLTTRRLAEELGVQGPALYHHFENKSELLGHMATLIMRESLAFTGDYHDWQRWLRDHASATRTTLHRYRDSARILAVSTPNEEMRGEIMPAIIKPLINAGFRRIDANETVSLVASFTLGFVINEQNELMRSYMASMMHIDGGFLHGVEALVAGVAEKYAGGAKAQRVRLVRRAHRARAGFRSR